MTVTEAYRRIAPVYDTTPNPLLALERRTLLPLLPTLRGLTVADIGAGTGRWLHHARTAGAHTVGLDLSVEMLAAAPSPRVQADAQALPLRDNCADVVFCAFTLGYAPYCFGELARITRPGGTVIVTDVHPDAIARGWSRSFRVGATLIEPAHEKYSIDTLHHPALVRADFIEPHLGTPERAIFTRAGKAEHFDAAAAHPAIFVALWRKQ